MKAFSHLEIKIFKLTAEFRQVWRVHFEYNNYERQTKN